MPPISIRYRRNIKKIKIDDDDDYDLDDDNDDLE